MTKDVPFKLLSIDGGGIKGLFSAEILAGLEKHYKNPISDYFDLICGTSTGGIIALALSTKVPASRIVDFYKIDGPSIFKYKNPFTRFTAVCKQILISSKHRNTHLKKSLSDVFGEKLMADSCNQLCIPSYNLILGRPTVFKSPFVLNGKNIWTNDENIKMVDVALATSAAPTYFPIHSINDILYVDGGVWANNPTLVGIAEALKYFINREFVMDGQKIKYTSIQVLSISSITQPNNWSSRRKKNRSALLWLLGNRLMQPFMDGQSIHIDYLIESLSKSINIPIDYKRVTHKELSSELRKNIELDKATNSAIKDISILGRETVRYLVSTLNNDIDIFFKTIKTFKTNIYG